MSTVGIIMLVHTALERAAQLARHWHANDCPVVIHIDSCVPPDVSAAFRDSLGGLERIRFSPQHRCEWGSWGLVAATQDAAEMMLREFEDVRHVVLSSGACIPLRPVAELRQALDSQPDTDFIEAVTTADVDWIVAGLSLERFTLYFPFSWRKRRYLFDKFVDLQRALKIRRLIPKGLTPHLGSQWWCLTRPTLEAILTDPMRRKYDNFFRSTWIPDESYFQTLARKHSTRIESRSLTLSKFDYQGKPYVFYDDHLPLLKRSDRFLARKIWPHANRLYDLFLSDKNPLADTVPNPTRIDRIFAKAVERRTRGRPGLYMQSRFPGDGREGAFTAGRYTIFEGFTELLSGFENWLSANSTMRVHGHLFGPERAEFSDRTAVFSGALSDNPILRNYNPTAFLTNMIWSTRGTHQCFQFGPYDEQGAMTTVAKDINAQIYVISGVWALAMCRSELTGTALRQEAARVQQIEREHLELLQSPWAKARVRIWSLSEFAKTPGEILTHIRANLPGAPKEDPLGLPELANLDGLPEFLQELRNNGMEPYLAGDFPTSGIVPPKNLARPRYYQPK